jgi:C-terminal processing protease CtpA/Prc
MVIKTEKFGDFDAHTSFPQTLPSNQPSVGSNLIVGVSVLHAEKPSEAIVQSVSYPSPAFDANLLIGDRLLRINGTSVESLSRDQLEQILAPLQSTEIVLETNRAGKQLTIRIVPMTYENALAKIGRTLTRFGPAPYHCSERQK